VEGTGIAAAAALEAVAQLGYSAVQWSGTTPSLRPREIDTSARRGIRGQLQRLELQCAGIDLFIPPSQFLDDATIDRAVAAVEHAIRFVADIAGSGLSADARPTVSLLLPTAREREPETAAAAQCAAALDHLVTVAERDGIQLADLTAAVDEDAARTRIGISVDPALVLAASRDPAAAVLAAGSNLVSARLVDLYRSGLRGPIGEPGEARLKVDAYRVALDIVGYRRALVVDARQWRDPFGGLRVSLERWCGRTFQARPLHDIPRQQAKQPGGGQ